MLTLISISRLNTRSRTGMPVKFSAGKTVIDEECPLQAEESSGVGILHLPFLCSFTPKVQGIYR